MQTVGAKESIAISIGKTWHTWGLLLYKYLNRSKLYLCRKCFFRINWNILHLEFIDCIYKS